MQIAETLNDGLKRAYKLTIPAADIDARIDAEVRKAAPGMRMPGFRPGKVPANLVRKMHGPALQQVALNTAIQHGIQQLMAEHKLRPAMQPSVALADDYQPGRDAALDVALEVLPDVPTPAIDGLTLERLTVPADATAIDAQLAQLVSSQKKFDDAPAGHVAAMGELVVMDFVGKVDGKAFDGGTGTDMSVELGSGRLIPGFEAQVVGVATGDERQISVTFPADYGSKELAGKDATFDLTIKSVRVASEQHADDTFAKSLGLEGIEQLRELIKGQVEQEHNGLTRTHMKRKLLDQLAIGHDFPVPPSMVDAEFDQIWQQLEHEAGHEADPETARAEMESEREDYRRIAERRVRLGLLLSEIGQTNGIEVSNQEMQRLIAQAAQQYPQDQRQRFTEYVQSEPMAAAQLRAPLYEDKVVDFLFERATVSDREATRAELEAAIEAEEDGVAKGHVHGPDCNHEADSAPAPDPIVSAPAPASDDAGTAPKAKRAPRKTATAAAVAASDEVPAQLDKPKRAAKKPTNA